VKIRIAIACLAVAAPLCAATAKNVDAPKKPATSEPRVSLSIKDGDVREVLQTLKKQCGVKNLIIDPNVGGNTGSIFVKDVPCSTAFGLVLRMSGLDAKFYPNSLVHVGAVRR